MTRLLDIIGLCAILLISAFPNASWGATPAPVQTVPPVMCHGDCSTMQYCDAWSPPHKTGCYTPAPSPTPHLGLTCFFDAFSQDGAVPEMPMPCVHTVVKPTHVPPPPKYAILCPKDTRRCSIYKLHNGAYELIQTATPLPGVSP